jgi:colicin import membrane protein
MNWNNRAFIYTAIFYTIVLFLFLVLGFTTPLPLPAEQGIVINFGEDETGSGLVEPRPVEKVLEQNYTEPPAAQETSENIPEQLTQDFEEAPAVVPVKPKPKKPKTESTPVKKPEEVVKPVEKPAVNPTALYQGRKEDSRSNNSEGEAGGSGNQGSLSGDVDATSHSLGAGAGDGISYSLSGRSPVALPVPEFNTQKEGRVVVRVRVDQSGKVAFAEPGIKGSTTLDKDLLAAAKIAALASRFNTKTDAPVIQEGTITYVFRLRGN